MKIYLFLNDRVMTFFLPNQIEGSYSFDPVQDDEIKLINIEERDNKWVIYSTIDSKLMNGEQIISSTVISNNTFYVLRKNNINYLIYITDLLDKSLLTYTFGDDLNMIIGNSSECNVNYSINFSNGVMARIYVKDGKTIIDNMGINIYINNYIMNEKSKCLEKGDKIIIFGLKIIILDKLLIMNNPIDCLNINEQAARISKYNFSFDNDSKDIVVKDMDLYDKDDYFSKSPRLRRIIETKKIKLSPPPASDSNQELPLILTIGPMFTMGITSIVMFIDTMNRVKTGQATMKDSWSSLVSSGAMLISMLLWPILTDFYNKRQKKKRREEIIKKYGKYLDEKREELRKESKLQKDILIENLITTGECLNIINSKGNNFWDKRIDQSDFLVVRLGMGKVLLDAEVEYPEEGFTIEEDDLKKQADKMVEDFKYIDDVPVSYSFFDNVVTAIMGVNYNKSVNFVNNVILQLITFYSYEDLKIVFITNEDNEHNWDYLKYLNHTFNNNRSFRFFSSTQETAKNVSEMLDYELSNRMARDDNRGSDKKNDYKPHYLIITDDYSRIKRFEFVKELTEAEDNYGMSLIIIEDRLSKLPSKCNNFISLGQANSGVLKNSYEKQEQIVFKDEVQYGINMMEIAKKLSNIPIEFENGIYSIPDTVSFLEMEKVGKVEQLNILNRWNTNDSTNTLKAEVGIDEQGDLMYLDLHEKYHGPHGLIAGTTGSGKSEFIITYILSMCINYSPDDVAFILIDYKGGGLALAFENKATGIRLPHLAGTITNLDKAEMDRTLVSIDSEVKRRQKMFNDARDKLEQSTIDIYKYQKFYQEGKLDEAIPHLFIICDEFAELKAQQPDFMDNLISVARIGRSLGVHLILATQKPSGVVNDQIWSNTKFRVCLKVQDEADSKEMLKRPEAAHITQAGRYYLQVGYDEYFALGQSGYCGAKYYPSEKIVKQVDKSINFLDDSGVFIKSIQASSGEKLTAQGEQIQAIMKLIIEISDKIGKKTRRLWLDNIPGVILVDNLERKYNFNAVPFNVEVVIGEYDAPEKQEQGIVKYNYLKDGNTIVYGTDGSEKELFLSTLIYSTTKYHTSEEVQFYFIDYGSESMRKFLTLPQVGGMVFAGEEEKFNNLFKLIREEFRFRKNLFVDYGGEYSNYIKESKDKLPLKIVIMNNFDSIYEANQNLYDDLPELVRDSERYGIVFILTANAANSVTSKISQSFSNLYSYRLKDSSDYGTVFDVRTKAVPRDMFGRGLINNDGVHEFQTANIVEDSDTLNEFLKQFIKIQKDNNKTKAKRIPTLPDIVRFDYVNDDVININNMPIGISKSDLEIVRYDLLSSIGNLISANKIGYTEKFVRSFIAILRGIPNLNLVVLDGVKGLLLNKQEYPNYYSSEYDLVLDKINEYVDKLIESNIQNEGVILVYGMSKFISKLEDTSKWEELVRKIKKYENYAIIIVDDGNKIKSFEYEEWFSNCFSVNDGVWIGKGISDQGIFRLSNISREMMQDIKNDMGYFIQESGATLVRLIDFVTKDEGGDNNE